MHAAHVRIIAGRPAGAAPVASAHYVGIIRYAQLCQLCLKNYASIIYASLLNINWSLHCHFTETDDLPIQSES